jgi:hypothetical protein
MVAERLEKKLSQSFGLEIMVPHMRVVVEKVRMVRVNIYFKCMFMETHTQGGGGRERERERERERDYMLNFLQWS